MPNPMPCCCDFFTLTGRFLVFALGDEAAFFFVAFAIDSDSIK